MGLSPLYAHFANIPLTYTPPRVPATNPDGTACYDAQNQRVYEGGDEDPVTFEVQLEESGSGRDGERPGVDTPVRRYKGVVVKTPAGPLDLPAGAHSFSLKLGGKPGTLRVFPDLAQLLIEREIAGQAFRAEWRPG